MAFDYFSGLLDEEQKNKEQAALGSPTPQNQSGQESAIVENNSQPTQPGQGTKSGSYTNLQSYLDANESAKFGKQVAGQVGETVDEANKVQATSQDAFKQRADSSAVGLNQDLLSKLNSDPVSLAKDREAKENFIKMRDAQYYGPKAFSDAQDLYSNTNQSVTKAENAAKNTEDVSGRKVLLDDYYGSGAGKYDYTSGQKKLDNYLIQVDPNSRQAFEDVRGKAKESVNNFSNLTNALDQYGSQKAQETAQTKQATRQALGIDDLNNETGTGALGLTKKEVEQAYKDAEAKYGQLSTKAKTQLANRDIDSDLARQFGLQEGMDIWGVDPTQYYRQGNAPTMSTVASKDQAAKIAALYDLAGKDNTYLPDSNVAGTYDPNSTLSFDTERFTSDVKGKESQYYKAILDKIFSSGAENKTDTDGVRYGGGAAKRGYTKEALAQLLGFDQSELSSGYTDPSDNGSIQDELGTVGRQIADLGEMANPNSRYYSPQLAVPLAEKQSQLNQILDAIQKHYNYGDKLR